MNKQQAIERYHQAMCDLVAGNKDLDKLLEIVGNSMEHDNHDIKLRVHLMDGDSVVDLVGLQDVGQTMLLAYVSHCRAYVRQLGNAVVLSKKAMETFV